MRPLIVQGDVVEQSGFVTDPPEDVATTWYPSIESPPFAPGAPNATVTDELPNDTDVTEGLPATTGLIVNVLDTSDAAAYELSPAEDALTVQSPMVLIEIRPVDAFTAHTEPVDVANVTVRPLDTVAPAKNAASSKSLPEIAGKVMVWLIFPATIVCVT